MEDRNNTAKLRYANFIKEKNARTHTHTDGSIKDTHTATDSQKGTIKGRQRQRQTGRKT